MTKTSQDDILKYIISKYHTKRIKYRDVICLILKVLPKKFATTVFVGHLVTIAELEPAIVATTFYFEHTTVWTLLHNQTNQTNFGKLSNICSLVCGQNH